MKRLIVLSLSICIAIAAHSNAAEPSPVTAKNLAPTLPKCDIKFEMSTEPRIVELSNVNMGAVESHYVATFKMRLGIPKGSTRFFGGGGTAEDYGPWADTDIPGFPHIPALVNLLYGPTFYTSADDFLMMEYKQIIHDLRGMPEKDRPPKELLDVVGRPFLQIQRTKGNQPFRAPVSFSIYASTPEQAKRLASDLIRLEAVGLAIPEQTNLIQIIDSFTKKLADDEVKLASVEKEIASLKSEMPSLNDYKDVDSAAMATYVAQRRLVDVDAAGTKAQIDACNQILARKNEPALAKSQIEHVEGVKIAAEVELAGLQAKRTAIADIIEKGRRRLEVLGKMTSDSNAKSSLAAESKNDSDAVRFQSKLLQGWQECPVVDNKVVIQLVKWVAGKQK